MTSSPSHSSPRSPTTSSSSSSPSHRAGRSRRKPAPPLPPPQSTPLTKPPSSVVPRSLPLLLLPRPGPKP
ncbi:unnamed protein product [Spirodela intermedia]|uniref:Uncharacterized protein n=1 Tax=Spirodela intermedia TaxID=51605 RepID=A0ABN7EA03_SPIIN|nr:unnamed protein product [Spirodela intermedia]